MLERQPGNRKDSGSFISRTKNRWTVLFLQNSDMSPLRFGVRCAHHTFFPPLSFSFAQFQQGRPVKTSPTEDKNTLFVGNIPTDVTQHELQTIITSLCGPSVVSVELKIGPPPQCLSRGRISSPFPLILCAFLSFSPSLLKGFCFVTFDNHDNADRARKLLQQQVIRVFFFFSFLSFV